MDDDPFDYDLSADEISIGDEEDDLEDDEDDDSDILEVGLDRALDPHGSDSDHEYGRAAYYIPFDNDLILEDDHRDRYSGCTYDVSVPHHGGNEWVHLFAAVLSGNAEAQLQNVNHLGEPMAHHPAHRDFPLMPSVRAQAELRTNICHHLIEVNGRTLLMYAVVSGSLPTVKAVLYAPLSRTEDTEARRISMCGFLRRCDNFNRSVFHYAAHHGHTDILRFLLDQLVEALFWPQFGVTNELDGVELQPLPDNSLPGTSTKFSVLRHESDDVAPTLLCQAALGGHLDTVKLLLSMGVADEFSGQQPTRNGALVASTSAGGPPGQKQRDTALICAATGGHVDVVKAILGSGVYDLSARGQFGEAAVHRAAACKHKDVLRVLLEKGADADAMAEPPDGWSEPERHKLTHYWGGTALLRAAHVGDLEKVNMLLSRNAKVDVADADLDTALHAATSTLHVDVVERLTGALSGEDLATLLAKPNSRGKCPLHCMFDMYLDGQPATYRGGRHDAVTRITEHFAKLHKKVGVSLDLRDTDRATPLLLAAKFEVEEAVRALLVYGADPNLTSETGDSPLTVAAGSSAVGVMRMLLRNGADANTTVERSKETALHIVIHTVGGEENCLRICDTLIEHGADVNACDADEKSPVAWAAELRKQKLLLLLFRKGGTVNWMSEAGLFAFHTLYGLNDAQLRAYEMRDAQQSVEACQKATKLCAGRDLHFVGGMINRALTEGFNRLALTLLAEHKGRRDGDGNNLLMLATLQGLTLVVKEMVYLGGINIEQRNSQGQTAIVIACREGAWESFLDLYGAGASCPNNPNAELMIAASLHQWMRVHEILQRLVDEQNGAHHCVRAGTPIPPPVRRSLNVDLPHHMMHVSPAVHATTVSASPHHVNASTASATPFTQAGPSGLVHNRDGGGSTPAVLAGEEAIDVSPALKRRRTADSSATAAAAAEDSVVSPRATDCGAWSPAANGASPDAGATRDGLMPSSRLSLPESSCLDRRDNGAEHITHGKLGWLIGQLMGSRDPLFAKYGQPCTSIRDRILLLLRPMMNFQEKVTFFQEEQDRALDYELEHEPEDLAEETMHIQVHRGQEILVDTVEQIRDADDELLRRELTVEFLGEEGEDGGGLLREFCHELASIIRDPDCALFQQVPEDSGLYQPSEKAHVQSDSLDVVSMFRSLGVVVAKAISQRACFPLRFTQSFLKQMLDEKLDLEDLRAVDAQHHQGLMNILHSPLESLGMDGLNFTTETSFFGQISTVELVQDGSNVLVTDENKHEYVQLLARHKMTESIKPYIKAFCEGLWSCIPLDSLKIFSPEQLGLLIAGQQRISTKDMMSCMKYEGFSGEEECIKWFWEIVKEMNQKTIAKLLAFMTGSAVVPAIGCIGFRPPLLISKASEERLPSSHTCANQLILSVYKDKELLKKHLVEALTQPSGFQFV